MFTYQIKSLWNLFQQADHHSDHGRKAWTQLSQLNEKMKQQLQAQEEQEKKQAIEQQEKQKKERQEKLNELEREVSSDEEDAKGDAL